MHALPWHIIGLTVILSLQSIGYLPQEFLYKAYHKIYGFARMCPEDYRFRLKVDINTNRKE